MKSRLSEMDSSKTITMEIWMANPKRDRKWDRTSGLKILEFATQDMEKILSMYAKGMTTGDIESHMRELYMILIFLTAQSAGSQTKSCRL